MSGRLFDLAGSRSPLACDWGRFCAGDRDRSFCRPKARGRALALDWKSINLADKLIDVTKSKHSISHRFVKTSDNLVAWLAPYAKKSGWVTFDRDSYYTRLQ